MRKNTDDREFDELSVQEQILRVQDLWDRIADDPELIALSVSQRQELERRLRAHEGSPGEYTSWEELRRRLIEASR